jgi:hypothetical protein
MEERHSEQRMMCADLVKIRIRERRRLLQQVATLEEISPSGACVQLDFPVEAGVEIEMICSTCRYKGRVRNCRFAGIGYDADVQFDEGGSWRPEDFVPRHLLDIPAGVANSRKKWTGHQPL